MRKLETETCHGVGLPECIISKVGCFRWFKNAPGMSAATIGWSCFESLSQPQAPDYILYTYHSSSQCV